MRTVIKWRLITKGDLIELWLTKAGTFQQIFSTTITTREFKANTYFGFRGPDQVREWILRGGFGEFEGLTVRRSQ